MSTVANWDERCYRCGNDSRFHYYDCNTGEGYDWCSICGSFASGYFLMHKQGNSAYEKTRISLTNLKIQIRDLYSDRLIAEFKLPRSFSMKNPERLYTFSADQWVEFMKQHGVSVQVNTKHTYVCLLFRTKGKKRHWVRFNYTGNWIEGLNGKKNRAVSLYRRRWIIKRNTGYGAMCITYKGNRAAYYRAFKHKPNIPHILKKWNRMIGSGYIPERSYLTVMEGDKLIFLKGDLSCYYNDSEAEKNLSDYDECGQGNISSDSEIPF